MLDVNLMSTWWWAFRSMNYPGTPQEHVQVSFWCFWMALPTHKSESWILWRAKWNSAWILSDSSRREEVHAFKKCIPSLKLTVRTWNWMVGILIVSFWSKRSIFRCFCCQFQGGYVDHKIRRFWSSWPWSVRCMDTATRWAMKGDLSDSCQCYYVGVNCRIFPLFFTHFCGFREKTGVKICPNYLTQTQLTELPEHLFGFARRCYFLDAFEDFLQVGIHWGNPMGLLWKTHNGWL